MNNNSPFADGTTLSKETTLIQKQAITIVNYICKIVNTVSEQETMVKTENPVGLEQFHKAVAQEEERSGKAITEKRRKELEDSFIYKTRPVKNANKNAIFNAIWHSVISGSQEWENLAKNLRTEVLKLAMQQANIDQSRATFDKTEGL